MEEVIIKVWASEGGYMYSIYDGDDAYIACEDTDGGLCTTTMENALDMAVEQARVLVGKVE